MPSVGAPQKISLLDATSLQPGNPEGVTNLGKRLTECAITPIKVYVDFHLYMNLFISSKVADSQYKFSLSSRISEIRLHESAERHSRDAGRSPSVPRGPACPGCCGLRPVSLIASSPRRRQVARAQLVGLQERLRIMMRSDLDAGHQAFPECLVVAWHPFHYSQPP